MYTRYAELRDALGLTDYKVSQDLGIPKSTISEWKRRSEENPDACMSMGHAKKIADYFHKPIDYFIGG